MTLSSLCPGYRQVDAFGPDDDYESEEEVAYVTLDLGSVEPALVPSSSSYRLIGLDTPTPFLQLSGTIFKGEHRPLLGTELLFTDTKDDHHDRSKRSLMHVSTTEQRIRFREVELREKTTEVGPSSQTAQQINRGRSKKDRIPETVGEVVGSTAPDAELPRARGGRGSRGGGAVKSNQKGKQRAIEESAEEPGPDVVADSKAQRSMGPDVQEEAHTGADNSSAVEGLASEIPIDPSTAGSIDVQCERGVVEDIAHAEGLAPMDVDGVVEQ